MIGWEKERALAEDLHATVEIIAKELVPLSPIHAVQRLLRFVDTHGSVLERVDDSDGRIQAVYWNAAEFIHLPESCPPGELEWVSERLLVSLHKDTHGLA